MLRSAAASGPTLSIQPSAQLAVPNYGTRTVFQENIHHFVREPCDGDCVVISSYFLFESVFETLFLGYSVS